MQKVQRTNIINGHEIRKEYKYTKLQNYKLLI